MKLQMHPEVASPSVQGGGSRQSLRVRMQSKRMLLLRGAVLACISLLWSYKLSHFPDLRPNALLFLPPVLCVLAVRDTIRCLQVRWSLHHCGVVLFLYADVMLLVLLLFIAAYPCFS